MPSLKSVNNFVVPDRQPHLGPELLLSWNIDISDDLPFRKVQQKISQGANDFRAQYLQIMNPDRNTVPSVIILNNPIITFAYRIINPVAG